MFPTGNGPGPGNSMHYQPVMQPADALQNQTVMQMPQIYQNQVSQYSTNSQLPLMYPNQLTTNQTMPYGYYQQPNQTSSSPSASTNVNSTLVMSQTSSSHQNNDANDNKFEYFSDDSMSNDETEDQNTKTHSWQNVRPKRKRFHRQISPEKEQQIKITNRFQSLSEVGHNDCETQANPTNKKPNDPKPPPIFIYGVTDYKAMVENLAEVTADETYFTKALANNTIKINPQTADTYRKLIRHLREANIVHHTYQLKQERPYRVVIRGLHHSVPSSDIETELEKKGHKVRNIMNIRHRVTKEPLPLFFVDLEPKDNNKDIFNLEFLHHIKIKIEAPRTKRTIIQCTRCQNYGHTKTYCTKPFNCVKCGGSHDTKTCKKPNNTPAKCALCNGDHPANYKGCTVYRDLVNMRYKNNGHHSARQNSITNTPKNVHPQSNQQNTINNNQTVSYAQAVGGRPNIRTNKNINEELTETMTNFLCEFKNMFTQLLNQNSMILTMLTTVINKITN